MLGNRLPPKSYPISSSTTPVKLPPQQSLDEPSKTLQQAFPSTIRLCEPQRVMADEMEGSQGTSSLPKFTELLRHQRQNATSYYMEIPASAQYAQSIPPLSQVQPEAERSRPYPMDWQSEPQQPSFASDTPMETTSPSAMARLTKRKADRGSTYATDSPHDSTGSNRQRASRYLSDDDRVDIITRINDGEKQVKLAKEYNVSRAAICNLYKIRDAVMARTRNVQTKKQRFETPSANVSSMNDSDRSAENIHTNDTSGMQTAFYTNTTETTPQAYSGSQSSPPMVMEISKEIKALRNLLPVLRDACTPVDTYHRTADRVVRILLESVIATLPSRELELKTPAGDDLRCETSFADQMICALTMEEANASIILPLFASLLPSAPTGSIILAPHHQGGTNIHAQHPPLLPSQAVFLLDSSCATGRRACAALDYLVHGCSVAASRIYYITIISSEQGLQRVYQAHPDVNLVTVQMDARVDEQNQIRPGIGYFAERYFGLGSGARLV